MIVLEGYKQGLSTKSWIRIPTVLGLVVIQLIAYYTLIIKFPYKTDFPWLNDLAFEVSLPVAFFGALYGGAVILNRLIPLTYTIPRLSIDGLTLNYKPNIHEEEVISFQNGQLEFLKEGMDYIKIRTPDGKKLKLFRNYDEGKNQSSFLYQQTKNLNGTPCGYNLEFNNELNRLELMAVRLISTGKSSYANRTRIEIFS